MPTLKRKWTPHPKQREILDSNARFRVASCGRRFGKTEMARHAAFEYAWNVPDSLVWWVGPTYSDADELGFDPLLQIIPEACMAREPLRTNPRKIFLTNGSVISFRSGEREDSLRGRGLDFLVIDEAGSVPDHSWKNELRPSLIDHEAPMLAIGTPRGPNWFREWFARGEDDGADNTASFVGTPYDNPHVKDSEIEQMRTELPERVFRQEVLAEFMDDEGAVFGNVRERNIADYDMANARTTSKSPYVVGIDLARKQNYLVAIAVNSEGQVAKFRRERGGSWGRLQGVMEGFLSDLDSATVYMDASRDNAVIENLDKSVPHRIESVSFGGGNKNDLIENLAARLETRELTIPGDTSGGRPEPAEEVGQLLTELEAYGFETTKGGNIKYGPPAGVNDDAVDAFALAAKKPKVRNATWGNDPY